MVKTIKKSIENIRDECDEIEENIKPKRATTRGDPLVMLH